MSCEICGTPKVSDPCKESAAQALPVVLGDYRRDPAFRRRLRGARLRPPDARGRLPRHLRPARNPAPARSHHTLPAVVGERINRFMTTFDRPPITR
jgi:hypothetical protein